MTAVRILRLFITALGLTLLSCQDERPISVLVITLDTTRADRLGCYGREDAGTPHLDLIAAEGTLFERAYTAVPITLPSHVSIFTGTYPTHHGVRDNGNFRVDPRLTTLAELLLEEGYATGAFIGAYPVQAEFGLDQGFQVYDDDLRSRSGPLNVRFAERPAPQVAAPAIRWLKQLDDEDPFFGWVHFFDAHTPYEPPEDLRTRFPEDPYQGEIAAVDRQIGAILEALRAKGRLDDTLIVVVADHGEGLGEHHESTHAALIYDTTMHVPMILRGPGIPSRRIGAITRTVDLFPTVTDLLGLPTPRAVQGRSLQPLWQGDAPDDRVAYLETQWPALHQGWSPLEGLVRADRKLIRAPAVASEASELFDLRTDPGERVDRSAREPTRVSELTTRLDQLIHDTSESALESRRGLTEEDRQQLQQLGYLGSTPDAREANQHPKDGIRAVSAFQRVVGLIFAQEFEKALELLTTLEERYPDSLGVFEYRALCYKEMAVAGGGVPTFLDRAIEQYVRALAINPELENLWKSRAEVHRLQGRWDDAVACYEQALRISPGIPGTEKLYAVTLAEAGRADEGLAILDRLLAEAPSPLLSNTRGQLLEAARRFEAALMAYEKTITRGPQDDPEVIRAHNRAGVIASMLEQPEVAIAHFEAVNRVRPDNVFARPRLARELEVVGRLEDSLRIWTELATDHPNDGTFIRNRNRLAQETRR